MSINITQAATVLGLGTAVTRQKIDLVEADKLRLENCLNLLSVILSLSNTTYLDIQKQKQLEMEILKNIYHNNGLSFVSVFCPPYKKGIGCYGYNEQIGSTTFRNIRILQQIRRLCIKNGVSCNVTIYFSDLLLENFEKLIGTSYRADLSSAFDDLCAKANSMQVIRLSELGELKKSIGEEATDCRPLTFASEKNLKLVYERNKITYNTIFGWDDTKVRRRTKALASAYPLIAAELNKKHSKSICYWSETAIERTLLMPNLNLPIFIPTKKDYI